MHRHFPVISNKETGTYAKKLVLKITLNDKIKNNFKN